MSKLIEGAAGVIIGFLIPFVLLFLLVLPHLSSLTSPFQSPPRIDTQVNACISTLASSPSCYDASGKWLSNGLVQPISESCSNLNKLHPEVVTTLDSCGFYRDTTSSAYSDLIKSYRTSNGWCCGRDPRN